MYKVMKQGVDVLFRFPSATIAERKLKSDQEALAELLVLWRQTLN